MASPLKLSIIVPVYNVEPYIRKCLESIEDQDIPEEEYEVIVVDDGTPDRSIAIVEALQQAYPNIRIVHKPNGGLSSARNFGLEFARGDYVWFIDSDDYIESNVLKTLLDKAYAENLDSLGFNNQDIYVETGRVARHHTLKPSGVVSGLEYIRDYSISTVAWSHIARREIYQRHNLRFTVGIYHEDYEFILSLYAYCDRMSYLDRPIYNYLVKGTGTITTTRERKHLLKRLDSWEIILRNMTARFPDNGAPATYDYHAHRWVNVYKFHALSALLLLPLPYRDKLAYVEKFKALGCFPIGPAYRLTRRRQWVARVYSRPGLYKLALWAWGKWKIKK